MNIQSYSPAAAGRKAGLSRSTIQRLISDGDLSSFKTPGGHVRIPAESLEEFLQRRNGKRTAVNSSALDRRREILESKRLRLQEASVDEELREVRAERRARAASKREERERREREQEIRAQQEENEARRIEFEEEQARQRVARRILESNFRSRWKGLCVTACSFASTSPLSNTPYRERDAIKAARRDLFGREDLDWLGSSEKSEIFRALSAEVDRREPEDEGAMVRYLRPVAQPLLRRFDHQRQLRLMQQEVADSILRDLPTKASDFERGKVRGILREQLTTIPAAADREEVSMRLARATAGVRKRIDQRLKDLELKSDKELLVTMGAAGVQSAVRRLYEAKEVDEDFSDDYETLQEAKAEVSRYLMSELEGGESHEDVRGMVEEFLLEWI